MDSSLSTGSKWKDRNYSRGMRASSGRSIKRQSTSARFAAQKKCFLLMFLRAGTSKVTCGIRNRKRARGARALPDQR